MNRLAYLRAMGIDVWVRRDAPEASDEGNAGAPDVSDRPVSEGDRPEVSARGESTPPGTPAGPARPAPNGPDWEGLRAAVAECRRCEELAANRTQTVFGVGDPRAEWMVIGEAPGGDEDRQGEPFVGRAGKLLNEMLRAAGFARGQVYIANILKCRPPRNRDPRPDEAAACKGFLDGQLEHIAPRLILVVGRIAAQNLLKTDAPIGRLRGRVHRYGPSAIPVVVTYHPAYLLRSPSEKRKVWADLKLALSVFREAP